MGVVTAGAEVSVSHEEQRAKLLEELEMLARALVTFYVQRGTVLTVHVDNIIDLLAELDSLQKEESGGVGVA